MEKFINIQSIASLIIIFLSLDLSQASLEGETNFTTLNQKMELLDQDFMYEW